MESLIIWSTQVKDPDEMQNKKSLNLYKTGLLRLRRDLLQRNRYKFCTDKIPLSFFRILPLESVLLLVNQPVLLLGIIHPHMYFGGKQIRREGISIILIAKHTQIETLQRPAGPGKAAHSSPGAHWGVALIYFQVYFPELTAKSVTRCLSRNCGTNWAEQKARCKNLYICRPLFSKKTHVML